MASSPEQAPSGSAESLQNILDRLNPDAKYKNNPMLTARLVLQAMRLAKDSVMVNIDALNMLKDFASMRDVSGIITSDDGIAAIVDAIKTHTTESTVQLAAFTTLNSLCLCASPGAERIARFVKHGAVSAIARSLKQHVQDRKLVCVACLLLEILLENGQGAAKFFQEDGPAVLVLAMRTHIELAELQGRCCLMLCKSGFFNSNKPASLVREQAIDTLVEAMRMHRDKSAAQSIFCIIALRIAKAAPEKIQILWNKGAFDCILRAMELFPDDSNVQVNSVNVLAFIACSGVEAALVRGLLDGQEAYEGQKKADAIAADRLVSKGFAALAIKAVETHMQNVVLQDVVLSWLHQLACTHPVINERIVQEGIMKVMLKGLNTHMANAQLLLDYLALVADCEGSEEVYKTFADEGGIARIVKIAKKYPQFQGMNYAVVKVVGKMMFFDVTVLHAKFLAEGGVDVFLQMLSTCKPHKIMLEMAIVSLYNFVYADKEKHMKRIVSLGAIRIIAKIIPLLAFNIEPACSILVSCPVKTHQEIAARMFEDGGMDALLFVVKERKQLEEAVYLSCSYIAEISHYNPAWQAYMAERGAIQAIVSAANVHKSDRTVMKACLGALASVTVNHPGNQDRAVREGAVKVVMRAFLTFEKDEEVAAVATYAAACIGHGHAPNNGALVMACEKEVVKQSEECSVCEKSARDLGMVRLLKCSACTIAPQYCSAACQKAAWKLHKKECKANPKS